MALPLLALAAVLGAASSPPASVEPPLARGARALAGGRPAEAEAQDREALAQAPASAAALGGLGTALFRQGRRAEALAHFREAARLAPGDAAAQLNLGYASLELGDADAAATAYARAVALAPEAPDAFYGLGEAHVRRGALAEAVAALEQGLLLEQRPEAQAWAERTRERVAALRAALSAHGPSPDTRAEPVAAPLPPGARLHPELAAARLAEGDRLLRERLPRAAAFAYRDATNADPSSAEAAFKLATASAMLGFYAQAAAWWRTSLTLTTDPEVHRRAAENLRRAQLRAAEEGGGSPLARAGAPPGGTGPVAGGEDERLLRMLEDAKRRANERNPESALRLLTEVLAATPGLAEARVARAGVLRALARDEEAAADYQHALRLAPERAEPLYGLAEVLRGQGRVAEARALYSRYATSRARDARPELQRDAQAKAGQVP